MHPITRLLHVHIQEILQEIIKDSGGSIAISDFAETEKTAMWTVSLCDGGSAFVMHYVKLEDCIKFGEGGPEYIEIEVPSSHKTDSWVNTLYQSLLSFFTQKEMAACSDRFRLLEPSIF